MRAFPALLIAAALLAGCATVVNPVTGQEERTVMTEAAEIAEGRKAHAQVLKEYGVYGDAKLQAYVDELGQRLAAQSHRAGLKWTFTVLDSPEINAFALPGGYVYVTRGIMAYLESEADLAGVIGHEIGHVTARHGAQRATRQQTAGLGVLAATLLGAALGVGDAASQLSQGVAAGYVASYSREQELQADQLGAEYLVRNRFNPQNMVDVITVLKNQERFAADQARAEGRAPRQGGDWLASHPSNDQRLQEITRIAARYEGQAAGPGDKPGTPASTNTSTNTSISTATQAGGKTADKTVHNQATRKLGYGDDGRVRYLQAIDGLPFGEGREQGLTRGRQFFHEPLGIALTAPPGWRIRNGQEAITVVNPAGDAALIVQPVPPQAGSTHEEILRSLLKPTQGRIERRQINGLSATQFTGQRQNAQGLVQGIVATVVSGPQSRNYLLLATGKDAAAQQRARAGLREAEGSFRALTAADRAAAQPWVLRAANLPLGGFTELARRSPLGDNAEAQLRLINGVYGVSAAAGMPGGPATAGAEPRPGEKVKVVE
jgi:predicted Zn-dependent protease